MRANNLSRTLGAFVSLVTFGLFGRKNAHEPQFQPTDLPDDVRPGFRRTKHRELTPKQRKARRKAAAARIARKKQHQITKARKLAA